MSKCDVLKILNSLISLLRYDGIIVTNGTLKNVNNICTLAINSAKYFVMFSGELTGLSSPSTNVWMDTGVTLQKRHFFLWTSTPDCLTTVSRISTEWKSSSLNRTLCGVIFNMRIGERFWIKELRVLHPDSINRKQ